MGNQAFAFAPFDTSAAPNADHGRANATNKAPQTHKFAQPDAKLLDKARQEGIAQGRTEGRKQGHKEGRAEAEAEYHSRGEAAALERTQAEAAALSAAADAFATIAAAGEAAQTTITTSTARLAAAMLQRIAPRLSDETAVQRAEDFVTEVARAAIGAPTLTLRVGAKALAIAEQAIGHARVGHLDVLMDDRLPEFSVQADWLTGSARYDPAQDAALLVEATERALAALSPVKDPANPAPNLADQDRKGETL